MTRSNVIAAACSLLLLLFLVADTAAQPYPAITASGDLARPPECQGCPNIAGSWRWVVGTANSMDSGPDSQFGMFRRPLAVVHSLYE